MTLCLMKNNVTLQGYVNADFGDVMDNRKSTSGYAFSFARTAIN